MKPTFATMNVKSLKPTKTVWKNILDMDDMTIQKEKKTMVGDIFYFTICSHSKMVYVSVKRR